MRLSVAFALALLPVPFLFVACGDDEAPANGATAASTSSGSGGSGGGGGEGPSLCTTAALTLPEVAFFSDGAPRIVPTTQDRGISSADMSN